MRFPGTDSCPVVCRRQPRRSSLTAAQNRKRDNSRLEIRAATSAIRHGGRQIVPTPVASVPRGVRRAPRAVSESRVRTHRGAGIWISCHLVCHVGLARATTSRPLAVASGVRGAPTTVSKFELSVSRSPVDRERFSAPVTMKTTTRSHAHRTQNRIPDIHIFTLC